MSKQTAIMKSLGWVLGLMVIMAGISIFLSVKETIWTQKRGADFCVPIKAIIQTGPQKEALKTSYLAEVLGLSTDSSTNTTDFNLRHAEQKLMTSPVINHAEVRIEEPGIVYIDYSTRQPVAFLYDYENVAIDQNGYPFPISPFYSPKTLPEIYLGVDEPIQWNQPITGEKIELAFALLKNLHGPMICDLFNVQRIDVSRAFDKSYGTREIVLMTQDNVYSSFEDREIHFVFPRMLRLSTKKYAQELSRYINLREKLLKEEMETLSVPKEEGRVFCQRTVLDFRISELAFINKM